MNRILTADVILTLTREQAKQLSAALYTAEVRGSKQDRALAESIRRVVLNQMARQQGVQQ